uniref:Uncharacterized protein n=1 Tax=Arundo donax TaxID=35708 RepID=A0A0A9FMC2_ARUDO
MGLNSEYWNKVCTNKKTATIGIQFERNNGVCTLH